MYQHTQRAILLTWLLGVAAAGALVAAVRSADPQGAIIGVIVAAVLALTLLAFRSLTVRVTDDAVVLRFGGGFLRRTIPTRDIRAAAVVRNRWYYGWGIRLTPHGWLWNVAGFDAVELRLASGRRFRIGTDDPAGLAAAIRRAARLDDGAGG